MKRHLDKNRHQLTDWERERLWRDIADESGPAPRRRRFFLPALGVSAALAVAAVLIAVHFGDRAVAPEPGPVAQATRPAAGRDRGPETPATTPEEKAADRAIAAETAVRTATAPAAVPPAAETAEAAPEPPETAPAAAPAPRVIRGHVFSNSTGERLPYTGVTVAGTGLGTYADSSGAFRLTLPAEVVADSLEIRLLGFDPVTVALDASAGRDLAIGLDEVVVATLDAIAVEGARYMVDVKGTRAEQKIGSQRLSKYALDSVEGGKRDRVYVRGGRSGEAMRRTPPPEPAEGAAGPGSVTGGTTPPNGEPYELMYFEHTGVNPFIPADEDPLSTFAVDVDEASWTLAREYLSRGHLPPPASVRLEEFVNAFAPGFADQTGKDFVLHADGAPTPFADGYHLLRLTVQGRSVDVSRRLPAQLVFVIDVSGSMRQENRLGLVKRALRVLVNELGEGDRVGIVVYGSDARTVLEPVDASQRGLILGAIDGLRPEGSTNAAAGLDVAYAMARRHYDRHAANRLILCSDGVANMEQTRAEEILERARRESDDGIHLSVVGFGMGNYNDVLMETLADKGDGNYAYVDRLETAERIFRENLTGTLQTIARDAKIQVEFDPAHVLRYRLLGYENRDVADRDFRNDAVDAGEIGAGHTVTALYELKLSDRAARALARGRTHRASGMRLATLRLRYQAPAHADDPDRVLEIEKEVMASALSRSFDDAPVRFRLQAAVAEFAEILRKSYWAKESRVADLVPLADALYSHIGRDPEVRDFHDAVLKAASLEQAAD